MDLSKFYFNISFKLDDNNKYLIIKFKLKRNFVFKNNKKK